MFPRQKAITPTSFVPITNKPAPKRNTTPQSHWREIMVGMQVGHWFEVPKKDYCRVNNAANNYVKGRYSCYQHPTKVDTYVFTVIK